MRSKKLFLLIKKTLIRFFLFNILFLSFSFLSIEVSRVNYSSYSAYLVNQRKNNGLIFNYGEVRTNNLLNYSSFYWYADNVPGGNLKGNMHTYFKAISDDGNFYSIEHNGSNFKTDVLLYTTWDFNKYHYNFKIITNDEKLSINTNEIYITEALANKLFEISNSNYDSILEKEISCQNNNITIKGVILNESLGFFENTVGTDFILGNFNYKPFTIKKMIYNFIMFGGIIDTTTAVTSIEKTIKSMNSKEKQIESYYYDFNNNNFKIDESQKVKEVTLSAKRNSSSIFFVSLVTFVFSITTLIFFEISSIKKIKENEKYKAKTSSVLVSNYLLVSFCFLINLLILHCINFIIVNDKAIYLFNYNLISSLFLFWILVAGLNVILNYYLKGKCNQRHDLVFEYNTVDI